MAYVLTRARNAMLVQEREYVSGVETMMFSGFDSCIGLITRSGSLLSAVHLVVMDTDCEYFDNVAAATVLDFAKESPYEEACLIGCLDDWTHGESPKLRAGFAKLQSGLKHLGKLETHGFDKGTYGAKVRDSKIVFTRLFDKPLAAKATS